MPFRGNNKKRDWRGGFKKGPHFPKNAKSSYKHVDQLTDAEVGITEYVSKLEGFSGVIKARFSDFQVNEIGLDGNLAKLTDITAPELFQEPLCSYKETALSPSDKISQTHWDALRKLVEAQAVEPVEIEANSLSKDDRRSIHEFVRRYFGKDIVANTVVIEEKTVLQFNKATKANQDKRNKAWPQSSSPFVHFLVYKEAIDTMDALLKIADCLRLNPSKITYAGVKDKRAKTTQWFCVKKIDPSVILSKTRRLRQIRVGNFKLKETCLKLGQLQGNRFRIALRNVLADDQLIDELFTHLKEHGFINYYGLQRFGNNKEVPTFLIGVKLLQGAWKEASNLILKVKATDDLSEAINLAKKVYESTGDAEKALKKCDKRKSVERALLEGLAKHHGNDYVNALENIPRNMRLMYLHAYQSLIWNKMVSKRIAEFGLAPIEGDLILVEEESTVLVEPTAEDDVVKDDGNNIVDDDDDDNNEGENESVTKKCLVRSLSKNELDKYTIYDIVLPLPGYDVIYPEPMKVHYKQAVEEMGLTLEMPKQTVRTYNLSGTYRKLMGTVKDVEWKIMRYNNPTDNLIWSDVEELKGEEEPKDILDGKYKAVVAAFTLSSASYATMALRELLKCNTSSSAQGSLNDYADESNRKLLTEENEKIEVREEEIDQGQKDSLLADKKKYEDFKNSLFKSDSDQEEEEITPCKKVKVDS